ncbi:MAG: hypothetical protein AAF585_04080 [Verrucomicrobiota bacterium]
MKKVIQSLLIVAAAAGSAFAEIPLPKKGLYLGQTIMNDGDLEAFEKAVDHKVAFVFDPSVVQGQEDVGYLRFNRAKAERYGNKGYIIGVAAYEAYAGHKPFNVDQLLRGAYDADLKKLAADFRDYGKPMMFFTSREPNGVLMPYLGGYGPNGAEGFGWAEVNNAGFAEFKPPAAPEGAPELYEGLGDPKINDGLERMAAAQRYYWDFFKRREGVKNLMFESMGWALFPAIPIDDPPGTHSYKIWESIDFEVLYPLIADYSDWISFNWHLNTHPDDDDGVGAQVLPLDDFFRDLENFMDAVNRMDPDKPVIVTELGFPAPSEAEKVTRGLTALLDYPQIKGIAMWGSGRGGEPDQLIRPGSEGAAAFRKLIDAQPDAFHDAP